MNRAKRKVLDALAHRAKVGPAWLAPNFAELLGSARLRRFAARVYVTGSTPPGMPGHEVIRLRMLGSVYGFDALPMAEVRQIAGLPEVTP